MELSGWPRARTSGRMARREEEDEEETPWRPSPAAPMPGGDGARCRRCSRVAGLPILVSRAEFRAEFGTGRVAVVLAMGRAGSRARAVNACCVVNACCNACRNACRVNAMRARAVNACCVDSGGNNRGALDPCSAGDGANDSVPASSSFARREWVARGPRDQCGDVCTLGCDGGGSSRGSNP